MEMTAHHHESTSGLRAFSAEIVSEAPTLEEALRPSDAAEALRVQLCDGIVVVIQAFAVCRATELSHTSQHCHPPTSAHSKPKKGFWDDCALY